jgi:hypothetical protein
MRPLIFIFFLLLRRFPAPVFTAASGCRAAPSGRTPATRDQCYKTFLLLRNTKLVCLTTHHPRASLKKKFTRAIKLMLTVTKWSSLLKRESVYSKKALLDWLQGLPVTLSCNLDRFINVYDFRQCTEMVWSDWVEYQVCVMPIHSKGRDICNGRTL